MTKGTLPWVGPAVVVHVGDYGPLKVAPLAHR